MVCAEHPIVAIANFVVFRSLASARRARPRAPSPARLRCVSCEGRGAQQGGALSVWVVPQIGEHKGVWGSSRANVDMVTQ